MDTMRVEIVSNEQNIYSGEAKFVVVPTQTGELGIYPRHMPIMNLVRPGVVRITVPNQDQEVLLAVSGGLLEVRPDKLTILAEVAVRSEEMDQARAEEARKNAEERLKSATDAKSTAAAEAALAAAIAELKTLDYIRSQKHK
ncbi:MAG: F0F1 ATP synthase subunit epsilon [Neisseriaceae bacterium]|nr:F0F1 ATP synthase subunit epsilon [Neisseriaceae bacterium]MBP5790546.1 F0F1 ATP synthase subunit epsilon [Neisseriaceae bacterium]